MAGHSHWAKIKRAKGANDAKRGRSFSKIARKIIVAARNAGADPNFNIPLRYAIDEARSVNMPTDAIDRNIKRAVGEAGGVSYDELTYEAITPGGAAILVETLTDNRNRTIGEVRTIIEKRGGKMAPTNAVAYMFPKKGVIIVAREYEVEAAKRREAATKVKVDEDKLMETALNAGAEDFIPQDEVFEIRTGVAEFEPVRKALADAGFKWETAEITSVPTTTVTLDAETGKRVAAMIDALEDNDDVQKVHSNYEAPDA